VIGSKGSARLAAHKSVSEKNHLTREGHATIQPLFFPVTLRDHRNFKGLLRSALVQFPKRIVGNLNAAQRL
jgi:hypothetical protein